MSKIYEYETKIKPSDIGNGGAYLTFPFDIKKEFGKGRISVAATFDGVKYYGSIVNMGVTNPNGSVCYIIGILKSIRQKIGKQVGDTVRVTIKERKHMWLRLPCLHYYALNDCNNRILVYDNELSLSIFRIVIKLLFKIK